MLWWKLRRFVAALSPLLITGWSIFSGPIRQYLLTPYDVRWYVSDQNDEETETVEIRNLGGKASQLMAVEIELSDGIVADFESAAVAGQRGASFLRTLSLLDSVLRQGSLHRSAILAIQDGHNGDGRLLSLEEAWVKSYLQDLSLSNVDRKAVMELWRSPKGHREHLQQCWGKEAANSDCRTEKAVEELEERLRNLQTEGRKAWLEATGVRVDFEGGYLSPVHKLTFLFTLEPDGMRTLTVRLRGEGPMQGRARVYGVANGNSRVKEASHLETNHWLLLLVERPPRAWWMVTLLALCLPFAWYRFRSDNFDSLSTHEIFNLALEKERQEFWEAAYNRRGHWFARELDHYWSLFGKVGNQPSADQIFELMRGRFRVDYSIYDLQFESKQDFEVVSQKYLRDYAIRL